ncbi:hypothetical protein IAT40_005008 [Kwoniella sp. CBS 6097]
MLLTETTYVRTLPGVMAYGRRGRRGRRQNPDETRPPAPVPCRGPWLPRRPGKPPVRVAHEEHTPAVPSRSVGNRIETGIAAW